MIKKGNIVDIKSLSSLFKNISHIEDKKARVRFDIRNAVLVLPPVGLEIYEDKKTTSVISNESKIQQIDLSNILAMIKKGKIKKENSFVDIIPTIFYLSNGKGTTNKLPLGMTSDYLGMKAIIYTLPNRLFNGYKMTLESAGIKVKKCVISPSAIAHLLVNYPDTPKAYIYVDVGATYTSISLISKTFVYNSVHFAMGGDELTRAISEAFRIDIKEAEKLKRRYGYDTRLISFNPVVCSANIDGQNISYTVQDLNRVIKDYLDNYIYAFDNCLNTLLSNYPEDKRSFPIILGGAASRLDGLLTFFKTKYPNHEIRQIPLKTIGARHEKYLNCIGAMLASSSYRGSLEDHRINNTNNRPNLNKLKTSKGDTYGG